MLIKDWSVSGLWNFAASNFLNYHLVAPCNPASGRGRMSKRQGEIGGGRRLQVEPRETACFYRSALKANPEG